MYQMRHVYGTLQIQRYSCLLKSITMEDKQITLEIDGHFITVPEGSTILEAATKIGINIPTLCHIDLKGTCIKNNPASCRICVVEVIGRRNLAPACATRCTEGMVVKTSTLRVMNARKVVAELILSDHPNDCLTCPKCGNCELQTLALRFNIREMPFNGGELSPRKREITASIVRNMDKCIFCRRCESVCNDVQTVGALGAIRRGFNTTIAPAFDRMMTESECTYCGQCVAVCPVGALTERDYTNRLLDDLANPDKVVIVQTAPAVRAALGEEFGFPPGTLVTGKMVYALRELGFDYVFDTDFAADLTIMEEGSEFIERFTHKDAYSWPMFTSCCPGWVRFVKGQFPQFAKNLSTAKSPQQMFGAVAKSYFAEKIGIDPKNLRVISVMPCTSKKAEAALPTMKDACGDADVDVVITTRELVRMLRCSMIDPASLEESSFDSPLGSGTGAAVIFGATGGVMDAALRSAYYLVTGENPDPDAFTAVRGIQGWKEASFDIPGAGTVRTAVVSGLGNTRKLMEAIASGHVQYDFVEVMACPGGCIAGACAAGGGQPIHDGEECAEARGNVLWRLDHKMHLRFSHENPDVQALYKEYLGKPLSDRSHHLLHTDIEAWQMPQEL